MSKTDKVYFAKIVIYLLYTARIRVVSRFAQNSRCVILDLDVFYSQNCCLPFIIVVRDVSQCVMTLVKAQEWPLTHEFDVSAVVQHQILGFEVAVDDALVLWV